MNHRPNFQFGLFHVLMLLLAFAAGVICGGSVVEAKAYERGYRNGLADEARWPGIDRRWTPITPTTNER